MVVFFLLLLLIVCLHVWKLAQTNVISAFKYSSCVGVEEEEAPDIDIYHCPNCEKTHGKSTCKYTCTAGPQTDDKFCMFKQKNLPFVLLQ